jgi:heterodisulfide reductase subunit B
MKYSYFPGCSLESNCAAYDHSLRAVAQVLDIDLVEIEDWNCCGATEYISLNQMAAHALIARNLAQAAKNEELDQVVAPCSACYLNLCKTEHYMCESKELAEKINQALAAGGLHYDPGTLHVRHALDIVVNDVGYEAVAAQVSKPLYGLRVAPYYGCLIVRPGYHAFDDPEHPTTMDKLLRVLGAEVVYYPMKAQCCGGHMTQISEETGFDLIRQLVKCADDNGADLIVTLCPMCQLNLDAFQGAMNRHFKTNYHMPVLYFTQMMGLAFGIDGHTLGIGAELVDARPALAKIGAEPPEKPKKKRRPKEALPMPAMLEEG